MTQSQNIINNATAWTREELDIALAQYTLSESLKTVIAAKAITLSGGVFAEITASYLAKGLLGRITPAHQEAAANYIYRNVAIPSHLL